MSTRCTIKSDRDESTGQGFHLYENLGDGRDCVLLDLENFTFETSVYFALSGRPEMRVLACIPRLWARKLGLIVT
jgi:hypothetical protein